LVALGEGQMSLPACADAQVAECLKRRDIRPFQAACSLEESVLLVKCDLLLPKSKAAPELKTGENCVRHNRLTSHASTATRLLAIEERSAILENEHLILDRGHVLSSSLDLMIHGGQTQC
jgi:hypothetical protein